MMIEDAGTRTVATRVRVQAILVGVSLMLLCSGCQSWPGNQAMRQYQLESDRLLSEFRSQKKRADELEQRNQQLEQRLGESEKLIARLQGRSPSRLADSRSSGGGTSGSNTELSDLGSASSSATRRLPGPGLPDVSPSLSGRLTSGANNGAADLNGDPSRSNQWRPIPGR